MMALAQLLPLLLRVQPSSNPAWLLLCGSLYPIPVCGAPLER
jgi:hypothetical protein